MHRLTRPMSFLRPVQADAGSGAAIMGGALIGVASGALAYLAVGWIDTPPATLPAALSASHAVPNREPAIAAPALAEGPSSAPPHDAGAVEAALPVPLVPSPAEVPPASVAAFPGAVSASAEGLAGNVAAEVTPAPPVAPAYPAVPAEAPHDPPSGPAATGSIEPAARSAKPTTAPMRRVAAPTPTPRTTAKTVVPARQAADRPVGKARAAAGGPSTTGSTKPSLKPAPAEPVAGAPATPPSVSNLIDAFLHPEKQRGR